VTLTKMKHLEYAVERLADGSSVVRPLENGSPAGADLVPYDELSGPFFASGRGARREVHRSKRGCARAPPLTVTSLFLKCAKRAPGADALVASSGRRWSWAQYVADARAAARALMALGMEPAGAVNVLGFNSPEWFLLNVGAVLASGLAAGVYTSNGPDACAYIAEHSRAAVVGVENEAQLRKYSGVLERLPHLKAFVVWDPAARSGAALGALVPGKRVLSWSEFMEAGAEVSEAELDARIARQDPGDACTLIYTSGTTGNPKAVAVSHDNVVWVSHAVWSCLAGDDDIGDEAGGVRIISYLPLSHVAGQLIDIHAPVYCTANMENTCATHFADSNALKGSLLATLLAVRPTYFFAVPRVWEKFQAAMVARGKSGSAVRRAVVGWARAKAADYTANHENGGSREHPVLWRLAKRLLRAARVSTGLDRCRVCLTSAAPISVSVLQFFHSLNIPVLEIFGLSESTGPCTYTHLHGGGFKLGAVGGPLPGVEIRVEHAPNRDKPGQGELCIRGRIVMMGYLGDEKKTRETIDDRGWLHTGDVATIDDYGMVQITGRIKELLISAGGENVAPVPIEETIKEGLPALSNAVLIGDKRKYFVLLATCKCAPNEDGSFSQALAGEALAVDPGCTTAAQAARSARWKQYVQAGIDAYNKSKAVSGAQRVVQFAILEHDFSVPTGELGPTLKLKRNVVNEKYAALIDSLYPAED